MKRWRLCLLAVAIGAAIALDGCGAPAASQDMENETRTDAVGETADEAENSNDEAAPGEETSEHNVLIAYFTRLDNTDGGIDTIIQGGGPYGTLGDSLEGADIDAISSASIQLEGSEVYGNTETLAMMIQKHLGGELFSIQTVQMYPADYDALIDQGGEEKSQAARPELKTHVENMEAYDVVLLGFPNWWYDMPMPVYSFLEEYDFSGKTVIPFSTSAGSGFSRSIGTIKEMLPNATVVENGLHIPMGNVSEADEEVAGWIRSLGELQ